MRNVVVDTCVIIHIVRATATGKNCIEAIGSLDINPNIIISVVTKAELESFSKQNKWAGSKIKKLEDFLNAVTVVDIKAADSMLFNGYVLADGYSKGKLPDPTGAMLSGSARKMGKNDLWIAATASAINASLITTDGDFDHLNRNIIDVIKIA